MGNRLQFAIKLAGRSFSEFFDDGCPQLAASIAYHVLFSLFPLVIVLAAVFGLVLRLTGLQVDVVDAIVASIPLSSSGEDRLRSLLLHATGGLSAVGFVGLLGLLWSASGMMAATRIALNRAWDTEDVRPFLRGKLLDLGLVFAVGVVAAGSVGATITVRALSRAGAGAGVGFASGWATWVLGAVLPLVLAFGVILLAYRFVPAAEVRVRDTWPAALFVAVALVVVQNGFAVYVENFADYNAIYGSLGAVIAIMFFVYLSASIFLLGAEVASEWPRVRRALELGETAAERPPLSEQLKRGVKGLWVKSGEVESGAVDARREER